jgi:hypothetical protein
MQRFWRLGSLWLVAAVVSGCTSESPEGRMPSGTGDTGSPTEADTLEITAFVQYHGALWVGSGATCALEITISPATATDTDTDADPKGSAPAVIEYPEEDGTCLLSEFENETDTGAPDENNSNPVTATESAYLFNDGIELELSVDTDQLDQGVVMYRLEPCNSASYPFDTLLDFELPATSGGYGAISAEGLLYTGLPLEVYEPKSNKDNPDIEQNETLLTRWETLGDLPVLDGQVASVASSLTVRNSLEDDDFTFEALACSPETGGSQVTLGPEQWALLQANPSTKDTPYYSSLQVDTQIRFESNGADPIEVDLVSALVSVSGVFHLFANGSDP